MVKAKDIIKQELVDLPINEVQPYEMNAKTHPKEQIEKIKKSIEEFGFRGGILVDKDLVIIAGHGRYFAMKELGRKVIPSYIVTDLTEAQIKKLRIADNKVGESPIDMDILASELQSILNLGEDLDATGYDDLEITAILSVDEEFSFDSGNYDDVTEPSDKKDVEGSCGKNYTINIGCSTIELAERILEYLGVEESAVTGKTRLINADTQINHELIGYEKTRDY